MTATQLVTDHLVFAAPDLDAAITYVERLVEVRPALGGRHEGWGTRNALLSLGNRCYLEIIAPDPTQPADVRGRAFEVRRVAAPRLLTWVAAATDLPSLVARARVHGVPLGAVVDMARTTDDGVPLQWQLSSPAALVLDGIVPALIAWGASPHPADAVPSAGRLSALRAEHPDPERVARALAVIGAPLEVRAGPQPRLVAEILTAHGLVTLT